MLVLEPVVREYHSSFEDQGQLQYPKRHKLRLVYGAGVGVLVPSNRTSQEGSLMVLLAVWASTGSPTGCIE